MKPIGLRPFGWDYAWLKVRGRWAEYWDDRIVGRPRRRDVERAAIAEQLDFDPAREIEATYDLASCCDPECRQCGGE